MIITVNYIANYRLNFATHYVFTECGLCFNRRSGKLIKQILKGSTIGYIINGKFKSLKFLRETIEKIPKNKSQF